MVNKKSIRTKGKLKLSRYFQEFKEGETVAVDKERSIEARFPGRLQGRTGVIDSKRGRTYIVKMIEGSKEKKFLINPIHLKKIKTSS